MPLPLLQSDSKNNISDSCTINYRLQVMKSSIIENYPQWNLIQENTRIAAIIP